MSDAMTAPLSPASPVVGTPLTAYPESYQPGAEELQDGELRVTVLGSGDPWVRKSQASGSLVIEVGNAEKDVLFFDLGSGALANFSGLHIPVTSTTKVFLSHLHADHIGDVPGLLGSLGKAGRIDPVEFWGGGSDEPELGLAAFVDHMTKALAWDERSVHGANVSSGMAAIAHEIPYDRPEAIYERNGVTVSSFPVIHALNGAVGYKIEYAGRAVVFSGDTRPCRHVVEAASGADLLIHECFQSPRIMAQVMGVELAQVERMLKMAHTVPDQVGQVLAMAEPRMAALWHLDLRPGVDTVFEEISTHYSGPLVASRDLTVYNVTAEAVVARQAQLDPMSPIIKGPSATEAKIEPPNPPPAWWAGALLDI
jgi:ribonuclease Z